MSPLIEHEPPVSLALTRPVLPPKPAAKKTAAKKSNPWRPMLAGETRRSTDQYKKTDGTWAFCTGGKSRAKWAKAPCRTRRPLPAKAKTKSKKR